MPYYAAVTHSGIWAHVDKARDEKEAESEFRRLCDFEHVEEIDKAAAEKWVSEQSFVRVEFRVGYTVPNVPSLIEEARTAIEEDVPSFIYELAMPWFSPAQSIFDDDDGDEEEEEEEEE